VKGEERSEVRTLLCRPCCSCLWKRGRSFFEVVIWNTCLFIYFFVYGFNVRECGFGFRMGYRVWAMGYGEGIRGVLWCC